MEEALALAVKDASGDSGTAMRVVGS